MVSELTTGLEGQPHILKNVSSPENKLTADEKNPISTAEGLADSPFQGIHADEIVKQFQNTAVEPNDAVMRTKVLLVEDNIINMKVQISNLSSNITVKSKSLITSRS